MRKKIMGLLLSFLLMGVFYVGRVDAHHYVYLSEDPTYQYPPAEGSEHTDIWVMWQWQQGGAVGWWVAPTNDPDFATHVNVARNTWITNISQLAWAPNQTSEALANIRFRYEPCPNLPTVLGCAPISEFENRPTENASYVRRQTIYINPNPITNNPPQDPDWTDQGRVGTIAHELGHVYGLHEQYVDPAGGCWDYTTSVMDGGHIVNGLVEHCDTVPGIGPVQGPTLLDLQRALAYWGQEDYGHYRGDDLPIFAVAMAPPWSNLRTVAQFKWPDLTWTEAYHYFEVFYSSDGQNWNPTPFHYDSIYPGIGVNYLTEPRAIGYEVNRANYGQNPGWFRACVRPYFLPFVRYGTQRCSNAVQLQ